MRNLTKFNRVVKMIWQTVYQNSKTGLQFRFMNHWKLHNSILKVSNRTQKYKERKSILQRRWWRVHLDYSKTISTYFKNAEVSKFLVQSLTYRQRISNKNSTSFQTNLTKLKKQVLKTLLGCQLKNPLPPIFLHCPL